MDANFCRKELEPLHSITSIDCVSLFRVCVTESISIAVVYVPISEIKEFEMHDVLSLWYSTVGFHFHVCTRT